MLSLLFQWLSRVGGGGQSGKQSPEALASCTVTLEWPSGLTHRHRESSQQVPGSWPPARTPFPASDRVRLCSAEAKGRWPSRQPPAFGISHPTGPFHCGRKWGARRHVAPCSMRVDPRAMGADAFQAAGSCACSLLSGSQRGNAVSLKPGEPLSALGDLVPGAGFLPGWRSSAF